jgi:hypothetical protein
MRLCATCEAALPEQRSGRPRKYCSDACKKRDHRRVRRIEAGLNETDRKLLKVWKNPELLAAADALLEVSEPMLTDLVKQFDLPAELRGWTALIAIDERGEAVVDDQGRVLHRYKSVLTGVMHMAIMELVAERPVREITPALIRLRVQARILDAIKASDEFIRRTVDGRRVIVRRVFPTDPGPDGLLAIEDPTVAKDDDEIDPAMASRLRKALARRDANGFDPTGNRAVDNVAMHRALRQLDGPESLVYLVYLWSQEAPETVTRLMKYTRGPSMTVEEWKSVFGPHDPRERPIEALQHFFQGFIPPEEIEPLLRKGQKQMARLLKAA